MRNGSSSCCNKCCALGNSDTAIRYSFEIVGDPEQIGHALTALWHDTEHDEGALLELLIEAIYQLIGYAEPMNGCWITFDHGANRLLQHFPRLIGKLAQQWRWLLRCKLGATHNDRRDPLGIIANALKLGSQDERRRRRTQVGTKKRRLLGKQTVNIILKLNTQPIDQEIGSNDLLGLAYIVRQQRTMRTNNRAVDGLSEVQQALLHVSQISVIVSA